MQTSKDTQGERQQSKSSAKSQSRDRAQSKYRNPILQRNGKFHEWNELCRDRIAVGSKTPWLVLWDTPRSIPRALSIAERMQIATLPSEDDVVETPAEDGENESTASAWYRSIHKEVARARLTELEKLRVQQMEVFGDLWGHLGRDVRSIVEMHPEWIAVRTSWDVIQLLDIVEDRLSGYSMSNLAAARDMAEIELAAVKQRPGQSIAEYCEDVRAAFQKVARYLEPGETAPSEARKVQAFIRGLAASHNEYKKSFYDRQLYGGETPTTLNEVKEDIFEFEQVRYVVDTNTNRSRQPLAVHGNAADKEKPKDSKEAATKKVTCFNCNEVGHYQSNCPKKKKVGGVTVETTLSNSTTAIAMVGRIHVATPTWITLDSGAETSVFCNGDLLHDIHKGTPVIVRTVTGSKSIEQYGWFGPIQVLYDPQSGANLLSQHDLEEASTTVEFEPGVHWTSTLAGTGNTLSFVKFDVDEFGHPNKFYLHAPQVRCDSLTVRERESRFTRSEVEAAKGVRLLKLRMGGVSDADLIEFIRSGTAVGCPFTPADVRRAVEIYGPDIASLKGKTTDKGPSRATVIDLPDTGEQREQTLHADVFHIGGQAFILAVMRPLKYTFCSILEGKTSEDMTASIKAITAMVESKGFAVKKIEVDPERSLASMRGVGDVDVVGVGRHVPLAERQGRVVKERCRLVIHSLPFNLAARMVRFLVLFVVTRLNSMPTAGSGSLSSRERFTGKRLLFRRNFELGFGEFVEIPTNSPTANDMHERTMSAIALYPVGNDQGSWYFYSLGSCAVVQRSSWTVLPMPDVVIAMLNTMAAEDGNKLDAGQPIVLERTATNVGEIPAVRLIANPALEVPRYGPDGLVVTAVTKKRKNRRSDARGVQLPLEQPPVVDPIEAEEMEPNGELGGAEGDWDLPLIDAPQEAGGQHLWDPVANDGEDDDPTGENDVADAYLDEPVSDDDRHDDDQEQSSLPSWEMVDGIRRSLRARRPPKKDDFHVGRLSVAASIRELGKDAEAALEKEFQQMRDMDVFDPIRLADLDDSQRKRIIRSSAFVKEKRDENGLVTSVKARWVGSGNEMDPSLYESGSSPTVATETVFVQLALAAGHGMRWATVDIGSAYLHSEMPEFVAVYISPQLVKYVLKAFPHARDFVDDKGRLLVKLKKALYGCLQSSRLWYNHIAGVLKAAGFSPNKYDSCLFHLGPLGKQVNVCLHVDDLLITANHQEDLDKAIQILKAGFREVKVKQDAANGYLGMRITEDVDSISVDMLAYEDDCVTSFPGGGRAAKSPAEEGLFDVSVDAQLLDGKEQKAFHTMVAKLLYLAKRSRPDLLTAVSFLASRVREPTNEDRAKLERVVSYLRGTPGLGLKFRKRVGSPEVAAYVDASYGIHSDGKSRSGLVVTVNGTAVMWKTGKQSLVTKSSTEAELVSLTDGCTDILWLREMLTSQGYDMAAIPIGEDNKSVMAILERKTHGMARTRHINVRYFFVLDRVECGEVSVVYVPTEDMLADLMTKPVTGRQFQSLRERLLGNGHLSSGS